MIKYAKLKQRFNIANMQKEVLQLEAGHFGNHTTTKTSIQAPGQHCHFVP